MLSRVREFGERNKGVLLFISMLMMLGVLLLTLSLS
jgi:hypothetical protein